MDKNIKEQFPEWCTDNKEYATVLSNDIDSLIGCTIEKVARRNSVNFFYDFNSIYIKDKSVRSPSLGIDIALTKGKCWDNHVTLMNSCSDVNPNSANINSIFKISRENYFDKYCMSTAILMWSYYDLPLPVTKLGKMLLLCVDVGFKGHYDDRFKDLHTKYLELLGYQELIDLLNGTSKQEYYDLIDKYKLYKHIELNEQGYLHTELPLKELSKELGMELQLPEGNFTEKYAYNSNGGEINVNENRQLSNHVVSFALTGHKYYKYTYQKEI